MLVCYLDDSDATSSSVVTLAGYAQSADEWKAYEQHAAEVYTKYEVDVLHTAEFHGTKDCFKKWSYVRKRDFIDELYEGTGDLFGISHSIPKERYKQQQKKEPWAQSLSAYGLAFNTMIGGFLNSSITRSRVENEGLAFIVEKGHKNDADIMQTFDELQKSHGRESLVSCEFTTKDGSRAIHLADLFAFYSRRQAAKMLALKNATVQDVQNIEEKMYTLINSKRRHITVVSEDPLGGEWVPYDEHREQAGKTIPPGNHLFSVGRRPADP